MNVTLVTVVTKDAEGDGKPCDETHVREETCDTGVSCPGDMQTIKVYKRIAGLIFWKTIFSLSL